MVNDHTHQSHPNIIKRLKRANGHLVSVIGMIDQGKPCLDYAIEPLEPDQQRRVDEFKAIARYL